METNTGINTMALKKVRRYQNAGSMVTNINPLLLQEEDAELLLNVNTENLGTWKKRPGTKLRGSQISDNKSILGIHAYADSAGYTTTPLVVVNDATDTNADIYKIVSSTLKFTSTDNTAVLSPAQSGFTILPSTWTNPSNAYTDNATYATTTVVGQIQAYKVFGNTSITQLIPNGSVIVGVEVYANGKGNAANMEIATALSWDDGYSYTNWKTGTPNNGSDTTITFGGSTNLWGHAWTYGELWDDFFGVLIKCSSLGSGSTYSLDHLSVKFYYNNPTNGAITTTSTSIVLTDATDFATSGTIEVDGDLITYTGKTSNTLSGVTGISFAHDAGQTVRQWTKSLEDDTASIRSRFRNFLDCAVRVNGTDTMKFYNGSAWLTTGNPINPQQATSGSLIEVFGDRMFLAGASLFPDRLYGSSLPSVTGNIQWTTSVSIIDKIGSNGYYIDINPEDGQNITAIERNLTKLLVFKERSMYTWDGQSTQADLIVDVGSISQEAIVTVHNITFFMGRSKKNLGIYAYTGSYPKLISRRIKKWIDKINQTDLSVIKAGADEDNVYFYIGNITFSDDDIYQDRTFENIWLVYTISQDSWKVYDNLHSKAFGYVMSSGQELLVFGDNDGKIFEIGQGTTDDSGNAKTPIALEVITREEHFNTPESKIALHRIDVLSRKGYETNVKYRYDRRDDWKSLGELDGRITSLDCPELGDDDNKGNTLQLQFTDYSQYQSMIDGYTMWVDQGEDTKEAGGK